MKKVYTTPELEKVQFTLQDVILGSPLEETIGEDIGGGESPTVVFDDGDL